MYSKYPSVTKCYNQTNRKLVILHPHFPTMDREPKKLSHFYFSDCNDSFTVTIRNDQRIRIRTNIQIRLCL